MKLDVKEILEKDVLDTFVKGSPISNFMQSYNWSVYQSEGLEKNI